MYTYTEINPQEYENSIITMFSVCYGKNISSEQFRWKYLDTKPEKMRTWAAFEKATDNPVAFYSAFKMNFLYEGSPLIVYQGSDAMVLKEHRRQGVFASLALHVRHEVFNDDANLFIDYCNEKSFQALMKISKLTREMCCAYVFFFPIGFKNIANNLKINNYLKNLLNTITSPVLQSARKYSLSLHKATLSLQEVTDLKFIDELDISKLQSSHILFPDRTSHYYTWKTKMAPRFIQDKFHIFSASRGNTCIGICVLSNDSIRNVLVIRSILCIDPSFFSAFLREIIGYALRNSYDGVLTNCASDLYQSYYKKLGFIRGNKVLGVYTDFTKKFLSKVDRKDFILQEPIDRDLFE